MAIPHARSGQPVSVHPDTSSSPQTTTLIKTDCIEVLRVVMSKGKQLARHKVPGRLRCNVLRGASRFNSAIASANSRLEC